MFPLKMSRCLANAVQSGHDFSLNLLVLDFVSGAVSLSEVDVAFSDLDLCVVAMQYEILYSLHFSFSWFTTWMWSVVEYLLLNPVCSRGWFSSSVFSTLFIKSRRRRCRIYLCLFMNVMLS